jgi:pimeloyl-ACP methyl ester carboxylesterase
LVLARVTDGSDGALLRPSPRLELALGALNGVIGDHLERTHNGLGFPMEFRTAEGALILERTRLAQRYPRASRRLAVFVHGLAGCELTWRFYSERHYGDANTTYGSRLEEELGYTPLYLRYNTGLHVSENGRLLAALLETLVRAWPIPVDEIALVGHSMGGLVARSACHVAHARGAGWVGAVRKLVCLGTPHLGAPLEKVGNVAAWLLGISDVTRPLATVLNGRSAGIKDLRFGYLLDDDWQARDPDALLDDRRHQVPFLAGATHYFVAATLTREADHPLARVIGDTLVRLPSAAGQARESARCIPFRVENGHRLGAMHHLDLVNHPLVYDQLRTWLAPAA